MQFNPFLQFLKVVTACQGIARVVTISVLYTLNVSTSTHYYIIINFSGI